MLPRILARIKETSYTPYADIKKANPSVLWDYCYDYVIAVGNEEAERHGVDTDLIHKLGNMTLSKFLTGFPELNKLIDAACSVQDVEDWPSLQRFIESKR